MTDIPLGIVLPSFLIILFAYFIRGASGFGSAVIAVPLLAHWLPLKTVVPFMFLLDYTGSCVLSKISARETDWSEVWRLLPWGLLGMLSGFLLRDRLDAQWLLLALGIFVVAFGAFSLLRSAQVRPISTRWAVPAGVAGSALAVLFGTGGPPYIVYLTRRLPDKTRFLATLSRVLQIDGTVRLAAFFATGVLLELQVWWLALLASPALFGGLWLGQRVHVRLTNAQMLRLVGGLLVLTGISLLLKPWL